MDLIAFRNVLKEAIDLARKDKRPTLIEAETYRYRGHSMSDPGKYRTKEEVEQMMLQDPIVQFGKRLIEQERFAQSDLDAVDAEIMHIVDECVTFSDESPFPSPEALYQDVYVRSPYINMKAAEKDPAWKASIKEDWKPEELPPIAPAPPAAPPESQSNEPADVAALPGAEQAKGEVPQPPVGEPAKVEG
jgi:hypothetical protein